VSQTNCPFWSQIFILKEVSAVQSHMEHLGSSPF